MSDDRFISASDAKDPAALREFLQRHGYQRSVVESDAGVDGHGAVTLAGKPRLIRPSKKHQMRVAEVYLRDGDRCWYCDRQLLPLPLPSRYEGERLANDYPTLDEIVPRSLGGSRHIANQRVACFPCNNRKGDRSLPGRYDMVFIAYGVLRRIIDQDYEDTSLRDVLMLWADATDAELRAVERAEIEFARRTTAAAALEKETDT